MADEAAHDQKVPQHYLERELQERVRTDPRIFDFIQKATLDGLWYWDLENPDVEWMNSGFWELLGIDPETKRHIAAEWQDLIFPEDLELALDNFQKHCADPAHPYDQLVRYRHVDGSTVWVRCRGLAIRDAAGKPIRMLGAHTDHTRLMNAQQRLNETMAGLERQVTERTRDLVAAEARFRQVFKNASIGMLLTDLGADGTILEANPAASSMLGYDVNQFVGMSVTSITHPEDMVATIRRRTQLSEGKREGFAAFDKRFLRKDGEQLWARASTNLIRDRRNNPEFITLMFENISKQKVAEAARDHALAQAESANAAKSNFLAAMSHELRTPMNAILGFSAMLKAETFGSLGHEKNRDYVTDIHAAAEHLLDLINQVLDLTKIEGGAETADPVEIDPVDAVRECVDIVSVLAIQSAVDVKTDMPVALPAILVDRRHLYQILINLLSNAVKFTPGGGTVVVSVDALDNGPISISISDTGVGIGEDDLGRILKPFERVGDVYTTSREGAGLGLPLANKLTALNGGTLEIESQIQVGTNVTVRFPSRVAVVQ